jgi:hypothetical protein
MVAGGFRKSFGASPPSPLIVIGPLAALTVLLATLIAPTHRTLLHIGAAAALMLVGFSIWQIISESATVLWFGLIFLGLWFVFYGHSLNTPSLTSA